MKTLTDRARHEQGRPSDVSGENTQEHGSDSGQTPGRDQLKSFDFLYLLCYHE